MKVLLCNYTTNRFIFGVDVKEPLVPRDRILVESEDDSPKMYEVVETCTTDCDVQVVNVKNKSAN